MSDQGLITMEVDLSDFERSLVVAQQLTGMAWKDLVRMQARLLVVRLMEWTRPFGKGTDAKKSGQKQVSASIFRVFTTFHRFEFRNLSIQKAWETEDKETLDRVFRESDELSKFTLLKNVVPAIHQAARKKGRVPRGTKPRFVVMDAGAKTGGGKIAAYARKVHKRVGKAKSGWVPAADFLQSSIPAWVRKAEGGGQGTVLDELGNFWSPSVTLVNKVPYVSDVIDASEIQKAVDTRTRDMMKWAERYAKAKLREAGFR